MSERKNYWKKMLRIIVNNVAAAAKSYYAQGLAKNDYYTKEKETEIVGHWGGKGSEILGLNGTVDQEQFNKLCDNINPVSGEKLTPRNNENRRVCYDINFHAPKSVSIVYAITEDKQILSAFRESVKETMTELEKDMQVRVRKSGSNENRNTGNLTYGEFIHTTTRPVNGLPDPHLHAHCVSFNASYDAVEQKWKAGEFGTIKKDASYFEAYFHAAFSKKIKEAGYGIKLSKKGWEIEGIERSTIDKFSRRTTEIEALAHEKGITSAKEKDKLGAKTRKGKDLLLSASQLKEAWRNKLSESENTAVLGAKGQKELTNISKHPQQYVQNAVEHILERKSVASEREILRESLKKGFGNCSPAQVIKAYSGENLIRANVKGETRLTTKEAVEEERRLIQTVSDSKGRFRPLLQGYVVEHSDLNPEQQKAVQHVLNSKDMVIVLEGGAGTGKTTLMKEIKTAIDKTGKKLMPFAPSADASRGVLESEGFKGAETVAQLLQSKKLQEQAKSNIIWIDEAGLLGNKAMNNVIEIARQQNARLILTGDTRQHNSVERGDAMRLIIEKAKLKLCRVNEIQRQRNNPEYKNVVRNISDNHLNKAFEGLERMNAIQEIADPNKRYTAIAKDYLDCTKTKQSVLVVAPTHLEGNKVTEHIRNELRTKKLIGMQEKTFSVQKNLSFTESEKKDAENYQSGMSVQFHQNTKGFKRGGIYDVVSSDVKGTVMVSDGRENKPLPLEQVKRFSVYEKDEIALTKGDIIRITQNGFSLNDKRLNNGNCLTIKSFDKEGNIIADSGKQDIVIGSGYRNLDYGYCSTSHSSQGKTVDKIIIAQSTVSSRAASIEQFYVSVSRGKQVVSIYTDDKQELKQSVTTTSQRDSAMDVYNESLQKNANDNLKRQQMYRVRALSQKYYQSLTTSVNKLIPRR